MAGAEGSLGATLALSRDVLLEGMPGLPQAHRIFLASHYPDAHVRRAALRSIGVVFEDDTSFVNEGFHLTPNKPSDVHVHIGRNVSIAPNVTCICDSCANNGVEINGYRYVSERLTRRADVIIRDDAWIGAGAVLLPGVTVGRCAVVGAGCVLTRDADDYGIYAGVPGRKVGDVRQWEGDSDGR
ncbi:acyltransferase [Collinsella ihumii]|uniref:DapH/DapD/GlmU-related protein n=1 Tax=Collinsella ihumii TaxID=1720204 RepID=A0AAW7JUS4_9ACTN|nr:DapH/DapD/GlmU-related protein [Collinsella ihumii]MDN0069548.1 DapH/DapD/GlmU-related protein [Collinsella ihumii]